MKKVVLGLIVACSLLVGCSSGDLSTSKNETVKEYETKQLNTDDVESVNINDDLITLYEALGKPLKEWDTDFVYSELNDAISRDELIVSLTENSTQDDLIELGERHSDLAEKGKLADEIKNLTMIQYTYSGEESVGTALYWISPKTDKVVYLNQRAFMDQNGERDKTETNDSIEDIDEGAYSFQDELSLPYSIGDTVSFTSEDGGSLDVTIQSVSKDNGDDWYSPEGIFFAKVTYSIKNTGTSAFDVNAHYLEFYDSSDIKSDLASRDYFSETIQAGKSAQATSYFEVNNDGDNFEIYFADTSWAGSYE